MDTIAELQKKLKMATAAEAKAEGALYPTGIIIDLNSPEGNVFYIMGLCQKLFRQLGLGDEEYNRYFKECQNGYYKDVLEISRRWFGLIYINEGNNND